MISLMVVIGLGSGVWYYQKQAAKKLEVTYKEYVVKRDDLETAVQATGSVQPENRLVVKPQIAGRVDEILIEEGKTVKAGQILAWMSSNDRAALLDMAKSQTPEEQKHWEEIYKPSPIIAPLGGVVISKQVERGQTVATSDVVFVISDRLIVLAQVDETDLAKISLGQAVEIRVDAYGENSVAGKVIRVAYESKLVNNVTIYEIRILPTVVPDYMRSGMTTSVKFVQSRKTGVVVAPVSFLKFDSDKATDKSPNNTCTVLVKSLVEGAAPEERAIVIGATNGKFYEIISGLDEGAIILQTEKKSGDENKASNPFSPFGGGKKRK
jgi:macrolide-specific efflux system membrane fusion protein